MATSNQIVELTTALCSAFNRDADEPLLLAYTMGLSDLPKDDLTRAATLALKSCKFMPTPAELRELAGATSEKSDPRAVALRAWSALEHARSNHWLSSRIAFADGLIAAVVRSSGGWGRLLEMPNEQFETWYRKEFLESYQALAGCNLQPEQTAPLIGTGTSEPVCIGGGKAPAALPLRERGPVGLLENVGSMKEYEYGV